MPLNIKEFALLRNLQIQAFISILSKNGILFAKKSAFDENPMNLVESGFLTHDDDTLAFMRVKDKTYNIASLIRKEPPDHPLVDTILSLDNMQLNIDELIQANRLLDEDYHWLVRQKGQLYAFDMYPTKVNGRYAIRNAKHKVTKIKNTLLFNWIKENGAAPFLIGNLVNMRPDEKLVFLGVLTFDGYNQMRRDKSGNLYAVNTDTYQQLYLNKRSFQVVPKKAVMSLSEVTSYYEEEAYNYNKQTG